MNKIKHVIVLLVLILFTFTLFKGYVNAREVEIEENRESVLMLDVARRYFTVNEIKKYIDVLSQNENSTLHLHFTDDENVGIECTYLDQTKENAILDNGVYTNPVTGKKFLTYDQVQDIMNYAKEKNVTFVPEIDVPAHMYGFFDLAMNKFGTDFVKHPFDWDVQENSGIAWKNDNEKGNIDLMAPNAKPFIKSLLDEYTSFFSGNKYFHIGFDEYTLRPEMKVNYINELYTYLSNKGFTMRMWSDSITKDNIDSINNNIEVTYWGWKEADILQTNYATVKDLQNKGFKVLVTNKYYLFFVPESSVVDENSLNHTVNNILDNWTLAKWNYNYSSDLDNLDNILGGMICIWNENSLGVDDTTIFNHSKNMYNAMFTKLDKIKRKIIIPDEDNNTIENNATNNTNENVIDNSVENSLNKVINSIDNNISNGINDDTIAPDSRLPQTRDYIIIYCSLFAISVISMFIIKRNKNSRYKINKK